MRLLSVACSEFRGLRDVTFSPDSNFTTMIGENGSGKSTTLLAVQTALQHGTNERSAFHEADSHRLSGDPITITIDFELIPKDVYDCLWRPIAGPELSVGHRDDLRRWLHRKGSRVRVYRTSTGPPEVRFGRARVLGRSLRLSEDPWSGPTTDLRQLAAMIPRNGEDSGFSPEQVRPLFQSPNDMTKSICQALLDRFKLVQEFRGRSRPDRTSATESLAGSDAAAALLNLKNHKSLHERKRYEQIQEAFRRLFPRFDLEAVDQGPGSNLAEILFYELKRDSPIPLSHISAGIHQIVTLLVNLMGRTGVVIAVEHPEEHLHLHSARYLLSLLKQASNENQILVTTHHASFCDPDSFRGFRRFQWSEKGTRVFAPDPGLSSKELAQVRGALAGPAQREVLFARVAVLLEDDSQENWLRGIAPRLGFDLDGLGVSLVPVGGQDGFSRYTVALESIGIPYVALRDQPWGDDRRYPPDRFFSLGAELENYLDANGLAEKRAKIVKEVGAAKPRVAAALAATVVEAEIPELFPRILTRSVAVSGQSR